MYRRILLGIVLFLCTQMSCVRSSDVSKAKELLPKPRTLSPEIVEIFKIADKILDSDDPQHAVSRKNCREMLARVRAKYGDVRENVDFFEKELKKLDAAKLEPLNRDSSYGVILLRLAVEGRPLDAIRRAEASSSPAVQAVGPKILGDLQLIGGKFDDAKASFERAITLLKKEPESPLKNKIIDSIVMASSLKESLYPVIMKAEDCVPKKGFRQIPAFTFSTVWGKLHQEDIDAGRYDEAFQRAEKETDDHAKSDYVKAVFKSQMKRGDFGSVSKTIDRFFPADAPKKQVAADEAAIFGRFDGRDLCLESWAIACVQHGRLAEARTIVDSIEELKRRNAVIKKLPGALVGKDIKAMTLYGLLPDTVFGGDSLDDSIPPPKCSDPELLDFCRWYAETAKSLPYESAKIGRKATAADLMYRLGLKKESNELYEKIFAEVLVLEPEGGSDPRFEGARPLFSLRIREGEFDAVFVMLKKLSDNGVKIPDVNRVELLAAMGKYDEAIAMADANPDKNGRALYYLNVGKAMLAADRKEDACKLFAKLPDDLGYMAEDFVIPMAQAGMTDEVLKIARRIEEPERRARSLRVAASQQKQDGNMADAEKTFLEAARCVEQIDPKHEGNRHSSLEWTLMGLNVGPEEIEKMKALMPLR